MAIRIIRNENGNCVTFQGSSQPAYWNACLSGIVNEQDNTRIDVRNDIRTTDEDSPVFEFFGVKYTEFQDADGNSFDSAGQCAAYITAKANVIGTAVQLDATDVIDFTRDATNTSILTSLGKDFGVNAIKATLEADGTISIREFQDNGAEIYKGLRTYNVRIEGQSQSFTSSNVVNSLNAFFTVTPVGGGADDPLESFSHQTLTPTVVPFGDVTVAGGVATKGTNTGSQLNDGFAVTTQPISLNGEYFELNADGEDFGRKFQIGLLRTDKFSNVADTLEVNNTFGGPCDLAVRLAPNAVFENSEYGVVTEQGFFERPQNSSIFRAGINTDRRLFISHYTGAEHIEIARSAFPVDSGESYMLVGFINKENKSMSVSNITSNQTDGPVLTWNYIESPDGSFYYPLFSTAAEADYVSQNANTLFGGSYVNDLDSNGNGFSHAHVFVDDPTSTTWYMPDNYMFHADSVAPTNSGGIVYNTITTNADAAYAPAAFTGGDFTFTENQAVNVSLGLSGDYTQAVSGIPGGLTYNAHTGYITGTTRYVAANTTETITVSRTNGYGTSTGTFDISITDNASLGVISGWTSQNTGSVQIQPGTYLGYSAEDGVYDFNLPLRAGDQIEWAHTDHLVMGIINSATDKDADDLGASSAWDWVFNLWETNLNRDNSTFGTANLLPVPAGSTDNTAQSVGELTGTTWKLTFEASGGPLKLYLDGVLKLTTSANFSSDQTISFWASSEYSADVSFPSWTRTVIGAGTTVPPGGFASPLTQGEMATTTIMGNGADAVATLSQTLAPGKRIIFPQTWVESNILPQQDSAEDKVFFGVPKTGANWNSVTLDDFNMVVRVQDTSNVNQHKSLIWDNSSNSNEVTVNSATDAFYDYALEWDGDDLHLIACNIGDINTQPGVSNGGSFSRTISHTSYTEQSGNLPLAIAVNDDGQVLLSTSGIQTIDIPAGANDIVVSEDGNQDVRFDGNLTASLTLAAGTTYRFMLNNATIESTDTLSFQLVSDSSAYTTGVTTVGSFGDYLYYIEFAVPSDVPPIKVIWNGSSAGAITLSGSTYTAAASGVTQEGPSANQTGGNFFDNGDYGWISIDDTITAGQRLVLNSTFLQDLVDGMPDNTTVSFGIKDPNWTDHGNGIYNNTFANQFIGGAFIRVTRFPSNYSNRVKIYAGITGTGTSASQTIAFSYGLTIDTSSSAFIEISADGDQVNCGIHNILSEGNAASTPFAFWPDGGSTYDPPRKFTTGDQGYNISTADIMVIGGHASQGSTLGGDMDLSDVDWTLLSEISVPSLPAAITTNYVKALDFSGGSEYAKQTGSNNSYSPLRMSGFSTSIAAGTWNGSTGNTSSATSARPWAVTCVFKSDGNSSNQHIWNQGEGSADGDDNIYVRVDPSSRLYFGWGRNGALNELYLGTISSSNWYGVYVASTGERLTGNNASAVNLDDCFDIRLFSSATGWGMSEQLSTSTNWNASESTTGGRMDRTYLGDFTIGGRSNNRNFHGKIASCVVTTLRRGFTMPKTTERKMMTIDPKQWMTDYKVGQSYRQSNFSGNGTWSFNNQNSSYATQVWLMGDGTSDAFSKIRNQAWPANQNNTTLDMNSMTSNDIETVNIPGLTD